MARECPVCKKHQLSGSKTMCASCMRGWQEDVLLLTSMLPDLEAIAHKQASPTPRESGSHGNQGQAPLPLNERPFELCNTIRSYAIGTLILMQLGHAMADDESTASLLKRLMSLNTMDESLLGPNRAEIAHRLRYEVDRAFQRREPRNFAGWCPSCGEKIYAPTTASYHECVCGQLLDLTTLRAGTITAIQNSEYYGSSQELSDWLNNWGLKCSARTIRRWAHDGKIVYSEEDESGRRTYSIRGILRQLQMQ